MTQKTITEKALLYHLECPLRLGRIHLQTGVAGLAVRREHCALAY